MIDDGRPAVLRRPVEEARDLEDFAWRQAQVDLYAKLMSLLAQLQALRNVGNQRCVVVVAPQRAAAPGRDARGAGRMRCRRPSDSSFTCSA